MRLPLPGLGTLVLSGALALGGMLPGGAAVAAPFLPQDDATVLDVLPAPSDPAIRALRDLAAAQRARPDDLRLALQLARRQVEQARRSGDPRHAGYAEAAIAPWLAQQQPPTEIRLMDAVLRQYRHDFAGALAELDQILDDRPADAEARLVRASVRQVTGRLDDAAQDCERLRGAVDLLTLTTCRSLVAEQSGHAASAGAVLAATLQLAGTGPVRLWALTASAEMAARRGDPAASEAQYREALALDPRDTAVLSSYADFLLDQGRAGEVPSLLGSDTRSDAVLLRLALAAHATGSADAPALIRVQLERFDEARRRGDTVHQREEARFRLQVLGDAPAAVALAAVNWLNQREPWDARILLDAAIAARQPAAARPVCDWLATNHGEDPTLLQRCATLGAAS